MYNRQYKAVLMWTIKKKENPWLKPFKFRVGNCDCIYIFFV